MAAGGADHHGGDSGTHSSGSAGALMPGMATADQISELTDASGVEAERLYLTLMIDHHEAGAEMAQAGMELADTAKVRELASKMVAAQRSEISALQKLLEQR